MKRHALFVALLYLSSLFLVVGRVNALTIPASEDSYSYRNTLSSGNASPGLIVDPSRQALVYFDLGEVPNGSWIKFARLRIFFSSVRFTGEGFTIHKVTGTWDESKSGACPTFDSTPVATVDAGKFGAKRFVSVDITSTVRGWLSSGSNEGLAIVSSPSKTSKPAASFIIPAKEGAALGLPVQLEVEFDPTSSASGESLAVTGPRGEKGETGPIGPVGPKGEKGDTGAVGPQGTKGEIGMAGPQGPRGIQGVAGMNGKTVLSGTTEPSRSIGNDGDFYINTTTSALYGPKIDSEWGSGTSLVGPRGEAGPTGPQGIQGAAGVVGPMGPRGETGAQGIQGAAGPKGETGATGSQGTPGVDGKTILNGTVAPPISIGSNGDFYINTTTSVLYGPRTASGWGSGTSLVGPQGPSSVSATGSVTTITSNSLSADAQDRLIILEASTSGIGWIPETAQGGMLVRRWFLVYRVRVNLPA
jgi:hypothetical protein